MLGPKDMGVLSFVSIVLAKLLILLYLGCYILLLGPCAYHYAKNKQFGLLCN